MKKSELLKTRIANLEKSGNSEIKISIKELKTILEEIDSLTNRLQKCKDEKNNEQITSQSKTIEVALDGSTF